MPARPELIEAVIAQESGGNPRVVSSKGATGLMQIEPSTATAYGFDPARLRDPVYNRAVGTHILSDLVDKHGGNEREALMSYYGRGTPPPGSPTTEEYASNVLKRIKPKTMTDKDLFSKYKDYQDAASVYEETQSYRRLTPAQQSMALDGFRTRYHNAMQPLPESSSSALSPMPNATPLEKAGPPSFPSSLDEFGKARELMRRATVNHPFFHWLAGVFPSDRPQAALDAWFLGTMAAGQPEAAAGPAVARSLGTKALGLAGRLAVPAVIGGAAGATESGYKAVTGAIRGFGEQAVGETIGGGLGLAGRLLRKPVAAVQQSADLARIGKWLDMRFPGAAGKLKNMADYAKLFTQRGLEDDANKGMLAADGRVVGSLLKDKQAKRLAEEKAAKAAQKAASKLRPPGVGDIALRRRELSTKIVQEPENKLGVTKARGELQDLLSKELGSTESRMKYIFDAPGQPPRRSGIFKGDDNTPTIPLPENVPDFITQKWHILGRNQLEVPFDVASESIKSEEKLGWDLAGHPIMSKAGAEARQASIDMEEYLAEQVSKIDRGAATEWLTRRNNQRLARTMTKIFGDPSVVDKAGNLVTENLMDLGRQQSFFDDLRSAVGPEEGRNFLDMLFRGAPPTATDITGKGMNMSVGIHPSLGMPTPRIWMHPPKFPSHVGNIEGKERGGRYLTALMALGTGQFTQMLGDFVDWNNLPAQQSQGEMPVEGVPGAQ